MCSRQVTAAESGNKSCVTKCHRKPPQPGRLYEAVWTKWKQAAAAAASESSGNKHPSGLEGKQAEQTPLSDSPNIWWHLQRSPLSAGHTLSLAVCVCLSFKWS